MTALLSPGDRIAVVAPSGPFDQERYLRGLAVLRARHEIREILPAGPRRYLAAPDEARAGALTAALREPGIRAVFAARGGYGAMRLLGRVDLSGVDRPLVGFSDLTALLNPLAAGGGTAVHGPVVTQLGDLPPGDVERLFTLLASTAPPPALPGRTIVTGSVEGPLWGGNLSVLSRLVGTPYLPPLEGAVLLLEDVGEQPYRLDRMLTHLRLAGILDSVAGVAFGTLTGCETPGADFTGWDVVEEILRELGKPAVVDLPVGHGNRNAAVRLGARVRLGGGELGFL